MNNSRQSLILTVNAGSSSIKFAIFNIEDNLDKISEYEINNIGQPSARIIIKNYGSKANDSKAIGAADHVEATAILISYLKHELPNNSIKAIGHRIVHGGPKYFSPTRIDDNLIEDLRTLIYFDMEHSPLEIKLIETFRDLYVGIDQFACFDTAFHRDMPSIARTIPIPRYYQSKGVRRYGFHGLSYQYIYNELEKIYQSDTLNKKIIIAHLGSGVSLTAISGGKSIDTTMGLTPASGVMMSTRSGDIDPGLASYLFHSENTDIKELTHILNFKSGLLGISETSSDMKQLLAQEQNNPNVKEAVDLFCYQIKKSIGSLSASLGGLDVLVFTGGIGEQAPRIRTRVSDNLKFLGIDIDEPKNLVNAALISKTTGRVEVRVIPTEESTMIARSIFELINRK